MSRRHNSQCVAARPRYRPARSTTLTPSRSTAAGSSLVGSRAGSDGGHEAQVLGPVQHEVTAMRLALIGAFALVLGVHDAVAEAARPAAPARQPGAAGQALRARFNPPRPGETRFVPNEVILDSNPTVPTPTLETIARRHNMTRLETRVFPLTGRRMHRWRLDGGGSVEAMIRGLNSERLIAGAQPNYLYSLAQNVPVSVSQDQYAPLKLNLAEAHRLSTGNKILIAVIDSGVDASHPELAGAISANYDAVEDDTQPHPRMRCSRAPIAAATSPLPRLASMSWCPVSMGPLSAQHRHIGGGGRGERRGGLAD